MKYIVSQYGARAHYAVARILHHYSALERLYTDICAVKGWPRIGNFIPRRLRPPGLERLLARVPVGIPRELITAFTTFGWKMNRRWARAKNAEELTAAYLEMGRGLSRLVLQCGFGAAGGVYAYNGEALELLEAARQLGLKTVLEQTIAPKEIEVDLLRQESELHPDWGPPPERNSLLPEFISRQHAEWRHADIIVCGSAFVAEGLERLAVPTSKIKVVPYGVDSSFACPGREPHRRPLRVLSVGAVSLRKGAPYVYEAARLLKGKAEFRLVGGIAVAPPLAIEISKYVQLTGRIPRPKIVEQLAWADVFVLPSVCEGSAVSSYEALAAGLPVVATKNAGTVVRDGHDGFIVPIRDAHAIAARIEELDRDRALLKELSQNACHTARSFSLEEYANRLLPILLG